MILLFPADPLNGRVVDPFYAGDAAAAETLAIPYRLISYETLLTDPERAVRSLAADDPLTVYRGWMLTPAQYRAFYDALAVRGIHMINDPAAYQHTHYLPESYPLIAEQTAKTIWLDADTLPGEIMERLRVFGLSALILKDYVKSQKHYWNEACFIPSAADTQAVKRVVGRFLELQGDDLSGGLVFREFIPFEPLTTHAQSGMPLTKEFRLFWLDGEPLYTVEYWEDADYGGIDVPVELFRAIAQSIRSRFFAMDVAKRIDGDWLIIELGDAQVAGLPDHADRKRFYRGLQSRLSV
jgi:hypothetical protein